jgi:hypothetical protein
MGRKSSLTEKQWAEIGKRLLSGKESARSLAREFGTSEASLRRKFPAQRKDVKAVANQIVAAEVALRNLPIASQIDALTLADELKAISTHLAGAGKYGAMTAHRLSGIAHGQVERIDDADPLRSANELACIALLTKVANGAAEIGIGLLKANKDMTPEDDSPTPVAITFGVKDAKRAVD